MLVARCGPNPDPSAKHEARMALVKEADVVCCTCVGAGSGFLNPKKKKSGKGGGAHRAPKFAGVLIDEAGQATEIAATVAVGLGCQQLVLVGDHHQLPPTGPGRPGAVKRYLRFPMKIGFVWRFCMGAQGA